MSSDTPNPPADTSEASDPTAVPPTPSISDDIRKQVENEQALVDAQRKLRGLEEELDKVRREKTALEGEKDGAISSTNQLRTQLSALQSSHHKSTSELAVLQTRIEAIEREKRELFDETERLQQRSSRNIQELSTLRNQRTESSQKIAHLDVEVSELKMAADSAKFNEERSIQSLQAARKEILYLNQATTDVEERFGKYRAEKSSELSQIQTEHETILSRLTSLQNSYNSLQRTYTDQSRRLGEAHTNISTLTTSAATKKATTTLEYQILISENQVLAKRSDEARSAVLEREAELERLANVWEEKERVWDDRWKKEERGRREAEKRSEDLKVVVERLALAGGEGGDLSPAAALAGGLKAGGKSYTQFYTDYTIQEGKLRAAENEVVRLTLLLDEISQDINEKKPLLDEQAAEHAHAIERANALALELTTAQSTRDSYQNRLTDLEASKTHQIEEITSLQQTTSDLNHQVQTLLRTLAIRDDPNFSHTPIDGIDENTLSGDIITDNLVEFKNLRSLQEQNVRLLKLTRGLMGRLDNREIDRARDDADDMEIGDNLDKATETIRRLHEQLLEAQKRVNDTVRERDFFSKLLAKGEGLRSGAGGSGGGGEEEGRDAELVGRLKIELEGLRGKSEKDVEELRLEIKGKSEAVARLEVEKARAEARVTLLEEQHRMVNEASGLQKQEFANVESQLRQVQGTIAQANSERRNALEQVAAKQAEADRLRNEAATLRAEKEQWTATESRLQADFRSVQTERAKLQQLIDNLNNVSTENERTRTEDRARLEKRIEELQRESATIRGQLDQAREATKAAEKKSEDIDSRLAEARKAGAAESSAEIDRLNTTIAANASELETANKISADRFRAGSNWKRRSEELLANVGTYKTNLAESEQALTKANERVGVVEKEVGELKVKIEGLEKKAGDLERGNGLKDGTISRLQSELTSARASRPAGTVDNAALTAVQAERDGLRTRLDTLEKELASLKANPTTSTPSAATDGGAASNDLERTNLQEKIDKLNTENEGYKEKEKASDAKYEENVSKVNRVNMSLRTKNTQLEENISTLTTRIETLKQEIADIRTEPSQQTDATIKQPTDQSAIDQAVKAALEAKEAEHAKALEDARAAAKAEPTSNASSSELDEARKKTTELEAERDGLKAQIVELDGKVKGLEKQLRTAEISRKTLERQKTGLEGKIKTLEGGSAPSSPVAALTPTTPAIPTGPAGLPANPVAAAAGTGIMVAGAGLPGIPSGPAAARGATRGGARGRGIARPVRGRGGGPSSILSAVNATLAQSTGTPATPPVAPASTPLSPTASGVKRPAPEEGEIDEATTTGAAGVNAGESVGVTGAGRGSVPGVERGRSIKRPRGGGPGRGGGAVPALGSEGTVGASEITSAGVGASSGDTVSSENKPTDETTKDAEEGS